MFFKQKRFNAFQQSEHEFQDSDKELFKKVKLVNEILNPEVHNV